MGSLTFLQSLIANFAIVAAYLFIESQILFRNTCYDTRKTFQQKVVIGVLSGSLGVILMIFTVHYKETILDFRQITLIIAALYGGVVSSVIASIGIMLMRLFAYGPIELHTVVAAASSLFIAVGVGIICTRVKGYWRKWIYSILLCDVIVGIVFFLNFGAGGGWAPELMFIGMMSAGGWLTAKLIRFLSHAKNQYQQMKKESQVDFLTGLHNHRSFDANFNMLLKNAADNQEGLVLALLDIDHFKKINDTYGHRNGDAVLKQLGGLLSRNVRPFDHVARNGGEEFSVLFYDTPHDHALQIAERLRKTVEGHRFMLNDGCTISLTVSIGLASYPRELAETLFEQADTQLYQAKRSGRNRVCTS